MAEVMLQSAVVLAVATLLSMAATGLSRHAGQRLSWTLITVTTGSGFLLSLWMAITLAGGAR